MKKGAWIAGLLWISSIAFLYQVARTEFMVFWCAYTIAFGAYVFLLFTRYAIDLKTGLFLAFAARLISLFYVPLLSDDYFRFIWDGMISQSGIHPMAYTPLYLVQHPEIIEIDNHLYSLLNSKAYYSVYPPVAQWIFNWSYQLNGMHIQGHILFYKLLLISADATIVSLLYGLLKRKNLPPTQVLWYALNPLVLLEFSGNLHMDSLMIAGLLGAVWLAEKKSIWWGSVSMVLSVASKMVTLVLIPFMPRELYWKKIIGFALLSIAGNILLFGLFFGEHTGWMESVGLWFSSFEFNASVYYLVRSIGFRMYGYNPIHHLGPAMALLSITGIVIIWIRYMQYKITDWSRSMLSVMTLYFLFSTTVHPWYLGLVLTLACLSRHYYPLVWTYLVMLSYSHYMSGRFEENYWLIAAEYTLLFAWMVFEWRWHRKMSVPLQAS